jgi:hypothetical protein
MNLARDRDAAGFDENLEARRDVDAVDINLLALDHRVVEVDADTELYPALGNNTLVLCLEYGLNFDAALDRVHHAGLAITLSPPELTNRPRYCSIIPAIVFAERALLRTTRHQNRIDRRPQKHTRRLLKRYFMGSLFRITVGYASSIDGEGRHTKWLSAAPI